MATKPKNLKSGRPIWQGRHTRTVKQVSLSRDVNTEVLVIGAGITAAIIADALACAGAKVAIVDKRGLAHGSTKANTALVQYEIDTPLTKLTRKIGKERAVRAWRRSRLAVEALAARFDELEIADVARRDSLYLAGDLLGRNDLRREHDARRASGLPSRFLNRDALHDQFGISRPAALISSGSLVIDPERRRLPYWTPQPLTAREFSRHWK